MLKSVYRKNIHYNKKRIDKTAYPYKLITILK